MFSAISVPARADDKSCGKHRAEIEIPARGDRIGLEHRRIPQPVVGARVRDVDDEVRDVAVARADLRVLVDPAARQRRADP